MPSYPRPSNSGVVPPSYERPLFATSDLVPLSFPLIIQIQTIAPFPLHGDIVLMTTQRQVYTVNVQQHIYEVPFMRVVDTCSYEQDIKVIRVVKKESKTRSIES